MPELMTAWITLAINTDNAERDIKRAFSGVNAESAGRKAGQQFSAGASQGIQGKMAAAGAVGAKALGGALTLGVAAVGSAAAATLGTALSKGFDRLKSIDDAKFKLKALGNSAADVQDIMDSALASVKGTAFGLGDAATIAASAVAAGVKPGQELTAYLKLTADAAAVAGTSLSDMGMIINQVRTSGSAYTEDLNQLAGRGIPIYQWLGDEAGVAASEVKKLAADGKISSEMLERAISKNIGGAAKTMGQSFSGAVENAQAALGRLGEALLKPAFAAAPGGISAITSALDGLTNWVNNNQGAIISFWEGIGQAAITTAQMTLGAVANLTSAFGNLVGGIGNVQGAMLKVQAAAADFRGDDDEAARLREESEAAFGWGESLKEAGDKMMSTAQSMDRGKESLREFSEQARIAADNPVLAKLGTDVVQSAANVKAAFEQLPTDVPINVSAPGGQETFDLLKQMGVEVTTNNDKQITVGAPLAPEVIQTLKDLGIEVTTNNDKTISVTQVGAEEASAEIDQAARDRTAAINVLVNAQAEAIDAGAMLGINQQADGGIVPMAEGGLRFIEKPDEADIYEGRGAGTIFAEEETGGEAYIPLAPAKRGRSTAILAEVARLFGLNLSAPSGSSGSSVPSAPSGSGDLVSSLASAVTAPIVSALGQIRDALASSRSSYSSSSPLPVSFNGSLAEFDSALLAQVPKGGRYDASGNLEQGLSDCSSAIEDLVNLMDGMPTSGREMSTGNAAEWLISRGFMPTDTPVPGAFNVGYSATHMEATLPGGTNVNFGSDASVASGGTSGAVGAWGDPSFTSHYYRAVSALDDNTESWSALTSTTDDLNTALEDRASAEQTLTDAASQQVEVAEKQTGGMDGSSLGQSIVSGMMQSIGLDGSVFSDPTQWANVKSGMALANYGGGLLQGIMGGSGVDGSPSTDSGGGGFAIPGLSNVAEMIKPLPNGAVTPQPNAPHTGTGSAPGPAVVVNGNIGMDPRQFTQRIDAHQNQAYRRNLNAVRP